MEEAASNNGRHGREGRSQRVVLRMFSTMRVMKPLEHRK